ncbi:MAG: DNA repair protein RecN [Anaerolineaceae bacterium]|nr:MAG: DNA repair protein RecN [Anaerolineaceae bacterium]
MLISLHVKNFAIINEVEVYFKNHLNILTGETGAGKSIIIDSINCALGAKVSKGILRTGADYALVELVFETKDQAVHEIMNKLDIPIDDNQIIISRKIMPSRSIYKLNSENVTQSIISEVAELLIDIHGQHEHQSLLRKAKHLEIVDRFAKDEIGDLKQELYESYKAYTALKQEFDNAGVDEEKRLREISFLEYEVNEIKSAALVAGEDEELSALYKKYTNAHTISEGLQTVYGLTGYEINEAGDSIGRAVRQLTKLVEYDEELGELLAQATDVEDLLNGLNKDLSGYLSGMDNYEEELNEVTKRLDLINHIKQKYGSQIEQIQSYLIECEKKLERYKDYDAYMDKLRNSLKTEESRLKELSGKLSDIRKQKAKELTVKIKEALVALNFLDVKFDMIFNKSNTYSSNGYDDAEFIISTNPGEELKSLSNVASGGELSRIMLGIKSVLAEKDDIETLIFDEIDTGISGRTAQKVSEQLSEIAKHHQIICITHLAQIAAMADQHFIIEKQTDGKTTETIIKEINDDEIINELARILGGAAITERVIENAKEMKELANSSKKYKI